MQQKNMNLINKMIVVDGLFHTLNGDPPPECNQDKDIIDMISDGGVDCITDSIISDEFPSDFKSLCNAIYEYQLIEEVANHKLTLVHSVDDIYQAHETNKLALILSTQGSDFLEADIRLISLSYQLGLRMVQITYNGESSFGSGVYVKEDKGLTRFGQQAILEMDRVGMLIDLSHVGFRTVEEAIDTSSNPTVFSHVGLKALNDHTRNIPDSLIKKIAKKGGLVGLCPHGVMNIREANSRPTVDNFIDAFFHVADITGSMEHSAIGTDRWSRESFANDLKKIGFERTVKGFFGKFDGNSKHVEGFNYYDEWSNLLDRMLARGISETDAAGIMGTNWLRIYKQVWK